MQIELVDGTGTGQRAEVTSLKQLKVLSESVPSEGKQSQLGNSFVIHGECHTAAAASGAFMIIENNEADYELEVTRIYIDSQTITPTDLVCVQVFDATESAGTDVSTTAVVQKNRGSSDSFDLTVKISDSSADLTYTGGTQYHAFPIKTMTEIQRNMNGTNIIPKGKSILFGWKTVGGGNATDGEVVSFSVNVIKRAI